MRSLLLPLLGAVMLTAVGCQRDALVERAPVAEDGEVSALAEVPTARTEVAGAVLGARIVIVGGLLADGSASAQVDVYEPETDSWSAGPALPKPAHHVGMTSAGGRVWVAGGYTTAAGGGAGAAWQELRDVWSLGDGESSWRTEPSLTVARGALGLAAAGDALVAFGGVSGGSVTGSSEVLYGNDPTKWVAGPPLNEPREHLAATTISSRVFAIAGRVGTLESNKRSVESWDVRSGSWRREPSLGASRGGTAASDACVAGGEEPGGTIASVECLRDGKWITVASLRRPRHGLAVVAFGTDLHVIGGGEQPGLFVSGAHEVVHLTASHGDGDGDG